MKQSDFKTVEEYISTFPSETQEKLQTIRKTIGKAVPEALEKISYQIPTFTFHGNLVHFAGYEHHIGFYPGAAAVEYFKKDLNGYETSKGTIQFPLDQSLPLNLVTKIVDYCVAMRLEKLKPGNKK